MNKQPTVSQRVAVFMDAQNLYHTAKRVYNRKVNFGAVLASAVMGRGLVRALAYVIKTEEGDETAFIDALHKTGIETRIKDLMIFSNGNKKADWDIGMAIDAVSLSPKVDVIVLVTGDSDFVPLVEYLRMHGVRVELLSFGSSTSTKLIESVDEFLDLGDDERTYLLPNPKRFTRKKTVTKPVAKAR
jgi:uncharacterized LabA/DUF88 family protein